MGQLGLDFGDAYPEPATCLHGIYHPGIDRTLCRKDGRETWVACHRQFCGQPPRCAWEPPDNSAEAVAARVAWMDGNK